MAYAYKREDRAYGYDKDTDYSQKMSDAAAAGDYASAARYEQQRNEKIKGEGLTQYQPTGQYAQYLPKSNGQLMDDTLDRILNREKFSYDLNGDALYQQYKDQYMQQGKLAMQDTMGQAAALTGGYGNSYAQTAGQQAYNQSLGRLNDVIPELYSLALSRYEQEGNDLWNLYGIYADRENQDYNRYIDERDFNYRQEWDNRNFDYQREQDEKNFAYQQEWDNKNFDYQQEWDNKNFDYQQKWDEKNFAYQQANFDYQREQSARDTAFNLAMSMLQNGVMPSNAVLTSAGLSAEDAQAIYAKANTPSYSGGGGGNDRDNDVQKIVPMDERMALAEEYETGGDDAIASKIDYYKKQGYDYNELWDWIHSYYTYSASENEDPWWQNGVNFGQRHGILPY